MPGGLPEVTQRFDADASGYIAGIARMIDANRELIASIGDTQRKLNDLRGGAGGAGGDNWGMFGPGGVAQIREYNRAMDEHAAAMKEASARNAEFNALQAQTERLSRAGRDALDSLSEVYRRHTETAAQAAKAQAIFEDGLVDQVRSTRHATVVMNEHEQAIARLARAYGTAQKEYANAPGWADAAARLAATAGTGAAAGGGGGGGGRGRWTAAAYASAGGGDMFPVGTAGHDASVITGFFKRWWTPIHFAIMGANELMATLLPAAAAAGAATMVGWEGAQQMIPRLKAINATAESLGGAYGITSRQYLGIGNAMDRYRGLAAGGVYELGGAGINLARMGAGTFGQTGLNTIAMLDRGFAAMQNNMQQRGTMQLLGGLAGKGTDYLRQFGGVGANLGNIFLGLAPHLPGVGEDYLGALEGITGAVGGGIGFLNQHGMGNVLGAVMAGEAGWRVGRPVVGLAGRGLMGLGSLASKIPFLGRAGLTAADIGDIAALTGIDVGAGAAGLGGAGLAGGLTSAGTALGMLGGPEVALAALAAFGVNKAWTSRSPAQAHVGQLQQQIGQAGFSAAFQPLAHAIVTAQGRAAGAGVAPYAAPSGAALVSRAAPGLRAAYAMSPQGAYAAAATSWEQTQADLVNAGPQLVTALKKAGLKSVSMADAFQIAQNALLDTTHAFDKHGHLTKDAVLQLMNYTAAIAPMTRSGGAFSAVIGAQQIMSSPAMQNLSKVNQAMDSMIQIASGGPAGMAGLMGMIGGAHPAGKPPAAMRAMAQAMTSFTSAGGAAAWSKFAGPSGVITAEQQNLDQLRTYMTLGALGPRGATGIAGFQLQQLLPMAKQSPAALALLMQQAAGIGIGGYYQGGPGDLAKNYAALQKSLGRSAFGEKHLTQAQNQAVINAANIPATAAQFMQSVHANIQAQQAAQASTALQQVAKTAVGGGVNMGALGSLVGAFRQQGLTVGHGLVTSIDAALQQAGVGKTMRVKIEAQVSGLEKLDAIKSKQVNAKVNVQGAGELRQLQSQIDALKGKDVRAAAHAQGAAAVAALNAEIAALHSKMVTITTRMITIGGMAGVTRGIPVGVRAPGMQTGGLVPGSGSGDIIPAMLEPGEAIIPRYLVPLIAPILAAHRVPGFGGMPQSAASHFAAGGLVPHVLGFPDPTISGSVGSGGIGHLGGGGGLGPLAARAGQQFTFSLIDGITHALSSAGARKIADALISKIAQEVQYAKNVSASMKQGLNLAGMDVTPGTGNGTVFEQMQSYLGSLKSFSGDLGRLRKGHLNKDLIAQLVAAGPVQGDALAQSILGGYGGIKGVNSLWAQIGKYSNRVGAQAAMAQYGGFLAPNLKSGSFTSNHVTVNVTVPGGGKGDLSLSPAQIKNLVEAVQAALLKQARRNNKTGLQLQGKGA